MTEEANTIDFLNYSNELSRYSLMMVKDAMFVLIGLFQPEVTFDTVSVPRAWFHEVNFTLHSHRCRDTSDLDNGQPNEVNTLSYNQNHSPTPSGGIVKTNNSIDVIDKSHSATSIPFPLPRLLHAVMANITIKTSAPVVGAGYLSVFWLCLLIDTFSNSFLGGFGTFLITTPVVGSLLALLIIEAVVCLEIPSQGAQDWWDYVHGTTGGALFVSVMSLPWILAIATLGLLVATSFWLGAGAVKVALDWIAKLPILGPFVALLLALSFVAVAVMLFAYVALLTFASGMRLIRAPRTGYVENGMPIHEQDTREDDEAAEGGQFGTWESNRG